MRKILNLSLAMLFLGTTPLMGDNNRSTTDDIDVGQSQHQQQHRQQKAEAPATSMGSAEAAQADEANAEASEQAVAEQERKQAADAPAQNSPSHQPAQAPAAEQQSETASGSEQNGNFLTRAWDKLSSSVSNLFAPSNLAEDSDVPIGPLLIVIFGLGVFGIHRVMMGGSPILILAYTLTGGLCGLAITLDFISLIISPEKLRDNDAFVVIPGN